IDADPGLGSLIPSLPDVVFSAKEHDAGPDAPDGVLAYIRGGDGVHSLVRLSSQGLVVSESPIQVLRAAECTAGTPAVSRSGNHHELVALAAQRAAAEERTTGGQL